LDSEYKTKRVVVIDDSPVVREVIISNLKKSDLKRIIFSRQRMDRVE
jgi:CheY-like chemotaxis protein